MTLYLKIDQDEASEFFEKYDTLSPLRKKIWNKISQKSRSWPHFYTNQKKLADWCGCSRSAISEAFRLFKQWGWLALLSRGWKKSKTILISHSKRMIDVVNRKYFKRVEATHRATHTYSTFKNTTSRTGYPEKVPIKVPDIAHKLGFSLNSGIKLGLLTESILQETLYQAKLMGKKGYKPRDEEACFVGMAFKIAKKQNFRPEWRKYYQMIA